MSNRIRSIVITALAVAALAACKGGNKDDAASKKPSAKPSAAAALTASGACDRRAREHLCGEYFGAMATADWVKQQCAAIDAPMVATCPTEGAVGSCTRDVGTPQQTRTVFYAPMTGDTVKAMCAGGQVTLP